jgi:hypothetical protein
MSDGAPGNEHVARTLEEVGRLLELQDGNPHRARSYRRAAEAIRQAEGPVSSTLRREGVDGLKALPGVGERLAGATREIVETGELGLLQRLRSEVSPRQVLADVPGVGEELAERIHERLGIGSLEELELAAHDGRLLRIDGIGEKKLQGIRDALAGMLSRPARRRAKERVRQSEGDAKRRERPPVEVLLGADREYRDRAESGALRTVAPKRFNPQGEAWLPVMEAERDGWTLTLLYSNTARAHERGKTRDWVVIYWQRDGIKGQNTVITAERGPLKGKRIVRGREAESRAFHEERGSARSS